MSRLFDAGQETQKAKELRSKQEEARRRAAEFDQAFAESGILDQAADKFSAAFAAVSNAVAPIRYTQFRKPGSKWMIEHAQSGKDYIFQVFPLRRPTVAWTDVIALMIAAMDVIFPRSLTINYQPPNEMYEVKYFTIRIVDVAGLPGWEPAIERALNALAAIDAWPMPTAP